MLVGAVHPSLSSNGTAELDKGIINCDKGFKSLNQRVDGVSLSHSIKCCYSLSFFVSFFLILNNIIMSFIQKIYIRFAILTFACLYIGRNIFFIHVKNYLVGNINSNLGFYSNVGTLILPEVQIMLADFVSYYFYKDNDNTNHNIK